MTATIEDRLVIGDASVLKEIYAQHGSLIHTIADQLQGPAADQFTISTFVEAWQHRREFDPSKGTVQAWLIRRLRSRLSDDDERGAGVIDRVVVTAGLARMESTRREILLAGANSESGATVELAERLNLPVGTVKAHLRRGMETLQYELADSRSDGDASTLVEIVRSRRLQADVVHPGKAVWEAIRAAVSDEDDDDHDDYTTSLDDGQVAVIDEEPPAMEEPAVDGELDTEAEGTPPIGESSDDKAEHDGDESTGPESAITIEPAVGPKTETDRDIARMRQSMDDPEPPSRTRTIIIAGIVAAIVALVVLVLLVV